ncbi:hypothetical protein ACT453_52975, partial [Bacillus sp. D-CC]
ASSSACSTWSFSPPNSPCSKLMPINRAYKLPDLMEAIKYYVNRTGRRITFEYGLFGGENDQVEHAEELAAGCINIMTLFTANRYI